MEDPVARDPSGTHQNQIPDMPNIPLLLEYSPSFKCSIHWGSGSVAFIIEMTAGLNNNISFSLRKSFS